MARRLSDPVAEIAMPDAEQRDIAEALFEQSRAARK
jgi:hypothetical protein